MSIFLTLVGIALILYPGTPADAHGVGIGLILTVQGAWFIPGAAKQVATEVVKAMQPTTVQVGSSTVDMEATLKLPKVSKTS